MHPLSEHARPDAWGVHTLEIDRAALTVGTLRVTRLECVLPDGTLVTRPHADDSGPLSLSLDESGFPQRIHVIMRARVELVATAPDAASPETLRSCPLLQIEHDEQGRPGWPLITRPCCGWAPPISMEKWDCIIVSMRWWSVCGIDCRTCATPTRRRRKSSSAACLPSSSCTSSGR